MFKLKGKEINAILGAQMILIWTYAYYSLMFFIAYTFNGQVPVFAGRVKIVSLSSCRTSNNNILYFFCPLLHVPYIAQIILLCLTKVPPRLGIQVSVTGHYGPLVFVVC